MNLDEYIKESETDSHLHWRLQEGVIQNLLDEAIERLQERERQLFNLIALLNRDGGHYQSKHGVEKAIKQGMKNYYDARAKAEETK